MVAVIQLAITLGASVGGLLFDGWGYQAAFAANAAILVLSALAALLASKRPNADAEARRLKVIATQI